MTRPAPFGAILAGGRNRRYGAPKALARIGGTPIIERVRGALSPVTPDLILIANDAATYGGLGLPMRPDARPGMGALGGIHTALLWAREASRPGVLAVACDMPFVETGLLRRLLADAESYEIVAPESGGRRGLEPLCAYYATTCIEAIEAEFERGERHVIGFFGDVRVRVLPLTEVRSIADPAVLFLNVNTPEERARAEMLVRG